MDKKEILKKYWWVGVALLAVLLLLRSRSKGQSTVSRLAAVEGERPTSDGIMDQTLTRLAGEEASRASRIAAGQEALAMQGLKSQGDILGAQTTYQLSVLGRATGLENAMAAREKTAKFQCPPGQGDIKKDPATGQLFCRAKARKGNTFTDIFDIVDRVSKVVSPIFGAPSLPSMPSLPSQGRTPPFIPGRV